ncbi:MAG TPA: OsmC family protein [Anaerolineales bacterium]
MSNQHIAETVARLIQVFKERPEKAISEDAAATTVVESGLRCKATGPHGWELTSDMAKGVGGDASAPPPGWLFRASLANCDASMIAIRAAELGVELTTLEVTVGSVSDSRGMFQVDDTIPAGPQKVSMHFKLGAKDVPEETLRGIVEWVERHSPVGDAVGRNVPMEVTTEIIQG